MYGDVVKIYRVVGDTRGLREISANVADIGIRLGYMGCIVRLWADVGPEMRGGRR